MTRATWAGVAVGLAVGGCPAAGAAQVVPAEWTAPVEPFRIADGIWYVGTEELASYLFTSDEGHVLLDVPLEANVDRVEANIRALGFDPGDVRLIVASQAHFDHVGGIATFAERHGAQVALSAADAEMAARGGVGPGADRPAYRAFVADRIVGHLEEVRVGDRVLTAHLTPGHTPGCTSWSGRATMDGAAVTWVSVCSLGVLPGYVLVGADATYPGIAADFCRSVAHLRSLPVDVFLGAHASFFGLASKRPAVASGDARALVDPDRYRRYLDGNAARIDSVLVAQGAAGGCAAG